MEISTLHQTFINNSVTKVRAKTKATKKVQQKEEKDTISKSINELLKDKIMIYQNPFLMAGLQDRIEIAIKQFQPDTRAAYKVNPVKASYDSNKAR